ncbi:MAG: hypothetical protein HFJ54_05565 [Clostridia bacterium]|nr:hypothetical protein [Clostridia bacterium]
MDAVSEEVEKHKIKLVIIAKDISEKSKENIKYVCTNNKVPVIEFSTMEILGKTIGKKNRAILGIKDKSFSEGIMNKMKNEIKYNGGDLLWVK